jgi:spore coat protein U-like protein
MRSWILVAALWGGYAHASCNSITVAALPATSFDLKANPSPSLTFSVSKSGGNGCDYVITVDYGTSSSYSGRSIKSGLNALPVQIYQDASHTQVLKDVPDATGSSDSFTGRFGAGNRGPFTFTIYPKLGTVDPYGRFGSYSDTFKIKAYDGTALKSQAQSFSLNYVMDRKIDLSLVTTGGSFSETSTSQTMAFGTLTPGATKSFDLVLKYNAGYTVKLSSANDGKLKHETLADTVPYSLTLGGTPVSLAGSSGTPVTAKTGTGVSTSTGLTLATAVTIGAIGSVRAGSYSDLVQVTVVSSE